jgi:hypothetical protein
MVQQDTLAAFIHALVLPPHVGEKADMWALGVLLYELTSLTQLFPPKSEVSFELCGGGGN